MKPVKNKFEDTKKDAHVCKRHTNKLTHIYLWFTSVLHYPDSSTRRADIKMIYCIVYKRFKRSEFWIRNKSSRVVDGKYNVSIDGRAKGR